MVSVSILVTMQQTHADTKSDANIASQDVGLIFVREYYTFLNKQPQRLHAFYSKDSLFLRGDEGESAQVHRGQEEIRSKIEELEFEDCKVLVTQVDSQASANDGIIIQVLGEMCNKNEPSQKFCQTFFLAPQANGYYVLNDIFRFLKDEVNIDYYTCEDDEVQHQQQLEQQKNKVQEEQRQKKLEELEAKKIEEQKKVAAAAAETAAAAAVVDGSLENKAKEEKKPIPVVAESAASSAAVTVVDQVKEKKGSDVKEEVVEKKEAVHLNGISSPAVEVNGKEHHQQQPSKKHDFEKKQQQQQPSKPVSKPSGPKTWANMAANDSDKWVDARAPVTATAGGQPSKQPGSPLQPTQQPQQPIQQQQQPPAQQQQQPPAQQPQHQQQQQQQHHPHHQQGGHPHGHGNRDQRREETQIFIKNVTQHINEDILREAFSQFGVVKAVNVVHNRNCAFLDFASTESVHKALNQHKVHVHNHVVLAEERRHTGGGGSGGNRYQHNRQQQSGRYERRFQQDGHRRGGGAPRGGKSRGGGGGGGGGGSGNNQK
ncbi:hypothetical protein BDA99DRAFT_547410 [Phascolomyces articulosus]|uniref:Uncharacterized protein n=1 Tax=Phascolomyces articulosus TaxID=60185 RepID=A0AAD5PDG8_9FUNG|nr:hypothetical protein BDA99DRAFT_547410 [Phascolomyces articulosus]